MHEKGMAGVPNHTSRLWRGGNAAYGVTFEANQ